VVACAGFSARVDELRKRESSEKAASAVKQPAHFPAHYFRKTVFQWGGSLNGWLLFFPILIDG